LGPVCIASVVNKMQGWEVEVIDENNYRRGGPLSSDGLPDHELLQELRKADVVGFYGGLTSTIPRLYSIAGRYKSMGVPTLAGGQHFVDENIMDALSNNLDLIIRGEGEESITECLTAMLGAKDFENIAGIAFLENGVPRLTPPRPPIEDFDRFPIPDFSLVRYAKIIIYPISRVRGCGMNCEFCCVKGKARYSSPERLMEQFMSAYERRGAKDFFVVDDLFGQDREETIRLCRLLEKYQASIGKNFFITVQIRLDKANDSELLNAMRDANIRVLAIGFESPIPAWV
jgi:anaerobic magnesium-protoporphyrin IX monomethyl ester cyclase